MAGRASGKLKWIVVSVVLSAIATLVVGIAAPAVVDYFKTPELKLQYYVQDTLPFKTESQEIAIYQVKIKNEGTRLLESIICRINVPNGRIDQTSISSSDIIQCDNKTIGNSLEVDVINLNPNENIMVYILVSGTSNLPAQPAVQLRAQGVTGTQGELTSKSNTSVVLQITSLIVAFISVISSTLLLIWNRRRL